MTRKVLVTGGTGFVGTALVSKLLQSGYAVRVLTRGRKATPPRLSEVEFVCGDVTKPRTLSRALEAIRIVVHLVGIIVERGESTFERVHYHGTVNLVKAAGEMGIRRFLYMSALGSGAEAVTSYHKTKFQAEQHLRESGLDFTIFRPSVILGPDSEFLSSLARMIRWSPFLAIPRVRKGRLQPIWVGDVVSCFVQAIEKGETVGQTYELGGPEKVSPREFLEQLSVVLGREKPVLEIPLRLMYLGAALLETLLPKPPVTREQLTMLAQDNTCDMVSVTRVFQIENPSLKEAIRTSLAKSE